MGKGTYRPEDISSVIHLACQNETLFMFSFPVEKAVVKKELDGYPDDHMSTAGIVPVEPAQIVLTSQPVCSVILKQYEPAFLR